MFLSGQFLKDISVSFTLFLHPLGFPASPSDQRDQLGPALMFVGPGLRELIQVHITRI